MDSVYILATNDPHITCFDRIWKMTTFDHMRWFKVVEMTENFIFDHSDLDLASYLAPNEPLIDYIWQLFENDHFGPTEWSKVVKMTKNQNFKGIVEISSSNIVMWASS